MVVAAVSCVITVAGVVLLLLNGTSLLEGFNLALVVTGIGYAIAGGLVRSRVPGNRLGLLFLVASILWSVDLFLDQYSVYGFTSGGGNVPGLGLAVWLSSWIWIPGTGIVLCATPVLFPDGHLPSRRWRPVAVLVTAGVTLSAIGHAAVVWPIRDTAESLVPGFMASNAPGLAGTMANIGDTLMFLPATIVGGAALVIRYRRSRGVTRLQMRWFTYAIVLVILSSIASGLFGDVLPILTAFSGITIGLVPVALIFAMLRYRLYEIDRIVSRTLGWALSTGAVAVVFAAGLVLLEGLLAGLTQGATLAVAASTLLAFAAFQPLRRRIQRAVDRRFDRARYDAERTAAGFADRLRDEVELDSVAGELVGTVASALRPARTAVWLRGGGREPY
jgi:hypothetical protein